jgi:ABC-type sugar transport system ATPase subunit
MMVGRATTALTSRRAASTGRKVLEVDRLGAGRRLRGLTFSVGAGEVVGLAGLPGSGAEDVFPALLGRSATTGGSVRIRGRDVTHSSLRRRIRAGVAYVSGDRRSEGLVRAQTVAFNLALVLNNRVRLVPISHRRQGRKVEEVISKLRILPADPAALVATPAGGNQQKVVVGRWLLVEPHLWFLNDPTRGVDVHSREEIHALVCEQVATKESSALMTSSDTRELLEVCDRLLVLDHGEIVAELDPAETTENKVLALAGGARSQGGR